MRTRTHHVSIDRAISLVDRSAIQRAISGPTTFVRAIRSRFGSGLSIAIMLLASTGAAYGGLCITPAESGSWRNSDATTRGITRVIFDMECRDATRTECFDNGICRTIHAVEAHYFLRVYGSCHPTDCHWGRVEGRQVGDWFLFQFNQGFATKYVWVRTYSAWPGWLRVYQSVIYHDGRANRTTDDWFRP